MATWKINGSVLAPIEALAISVFFNFFGGDLVNEVTDWVVHGFASWWNELNQNTHGTPTLRKAIAFFRMGFLIFFAILFGWVFGAVVLWFS